MTVVQDLTGITPEKLAGVFKLSGRARRHMVDLMAWLMESAKKGLTITDPEEKREFAKSLLEIMSPDNQVSVADLEEGVSLEAKKKLREWRIKLGQTIRGLRLRKKWTQEELAHRSGLPQSHVSRLETGKHAASYLTMQHLAEALGVKPSKIDPGYPE